MSTHKNTGLGLLKAKLHRRLFLTTALAGTATAAAATAVAAVPPFEVPKLRVAAPQPEWPPDELVQEALGEMVQRDVAEFAAHLETTRSLWRRYPELVEAREFPEHLRVAYIAQNHGEEPSDDCGIGGEEAFEPGYRESLLPSAIETAKFWMKNRNGLG